MKTRITLFTVLSLAIFCASINIRGAWRTHVSSAPALRGARQGSSVTRRNWEYLVEDAYKDRGREGWELVWVTSDYYFKRASIATSKGRPTWEYRAEDAYNDSGQAQRVLNQRGDEGWEFVGEAGNYYFFKRVASQGRPTWEYIVEDAYNDPGQAQRVLNQRGDEGWEFVERFGNYYYLKRTASATSKGRQTWDYLVDGAYNDAGQGQRVLNERAREGWDFVLRRGDYYYFKRSSLATTKGRPTWEYLVEDASNDSGQTQRVLNQSGRQGWEFVETDGTYCYLKRASIASPTNREEAVRTPAARPSRREQITLEYNVYYLCNGERVMVTRCRKDSDQPGFPPTQPNQDYCQVSYPDRPKRGGFRRERRRTPRRLDQEAAGVHALRADHAVSGSNISIEGIIGGIVRLTQLRGKDPVSDAYCRDAHRLSVSSSNPKIEIIAISGAQEEL